MYSYLQVKPFIEFSEFGNLSDIVNLSDILVCQVGLPCGRHLFTLVPYIRLAEGIALGMLNFSMATLESDSEGKNDHENDNKNYHEMQF